VVTNIAFLFECHDNSIFYSLAANHLPEDWYSYIGFQIDWNLPKPPTLLIISYPDTGKMISKSVTFGQGPITSI